jgi:hypothetical protein
VKHIDLDKQSAAVKQFILSLPLDPEGSILEADGRAVVRVLPVAPEGNGGIPAAGDWTEAKNARRCALIDKEIEGILVPAESQELQALQQEMLRHRRRVAPLPLEDARQLHQELLDGAAKGPPKA